MAESLFLSLEGLMGEFVAGHGNYHLTGDDLILLLELGGHFEDFRGSSGTAEGGAGPAAHEEDSSEPIEEFQDFVERLLFGNGSYHGEFS